MDGWIKIHRKIEGKILSATLSETSTDKYFVSICCEVEKQNSLIDSDKIIAIDLGIKSFLTDSEGNHIENPKYLVKSISNSKV